MLVRAVGELALSSGMDSMSNVAAGLVIAPLKAATTGNEGEKH
jgi:hypothetical protein